MSDNELNEILKEIKARNTEETQPSAPESVAQEIKGETAEAEAGEIFSIAPEEGTTEVSDSEAPETPEEDNFVEITEPAEEAATNMEEEGAMNIAMIAEDLPAEEIPPVEGEVNLMDPEPEEDEPRRGGGKKAVIAILAVIIVAALAVGGYLYFSGKLFPKDDKPTEAAITTTEAVSAEYDSGTANPLTGEFGFNKNALTLRPVAVVVENEYSTESVRPQWGMKEADIVMEGESEFSTRLLFFYADMMSMPKQIGPSRSARPPFIRFSQLWDCVFIHTGLSRSKGDYIGADQVFENENIDHINLLAQAEDGKYFGRDNSRQTAVEHTGYLNGTNVVELIEKNKIRTGLKEERLTRFQFNDEAEPMSETKAEKATFKWSDRCPKTAVFTYDESKHKYTTEDFDSKYGTADLEYETLILMLDETEYVIKENYKGSGKSETYCNYYLSGGDAKVLSEGTVVDVKWEKKNGKLLLTKSDGTELKLNRGKIYIAYGSSNHKGSMTTE